MSHTVGSLIDCPKLQDKIDGYFTACPPGQITNDRIDFLEFLVSPMNRANILNSRVNPGSGKTRTVQLTWTPRILEDEISDSAAMVCTSENEAGMQDQDYSLDIDVGGGWDEFVEMKSLATICESNDSWIASRIMAGMDAIVRKMDTDMVQQSEAYIGNFGQGEEDVAGDPPVKTVTTKYSDDKLSPDLAGDIQFAAMNAGYCGGPVVVGWGELIKWARKMQAGCCADQGIDVFQYLQQAGIVFLSDRRIETVYGVNNFISLAPGALQVLYYNQFEGPYGTLSDDSYVQTVINDPRTGLPFDFYAKHDCGKVHFNLKLAYKLVGLPTDLLSVGDPYAGITQVNQYVITNP